MEIRLAVILSIPSNHNYNKIVKSHLLSTVLNSILIGQYKSCLSNWTVQQCMPSSALTWIGFLFSLLAKNGISCVWIGNRTLCYPIQFVIMVFNKNRTPLCCYVILLITYDYRWNWSPLSPILPLLILFFSLLGQVIALWFVTLMINSLAWKVQ